MFDKIYDDTINKKIDKYEELSIGDVSRVITALLIRDERPFESICSSIRLLKGFSRLLLNLSILHDERAVELFRRFVHYNSVGHGAFVIFNFLCPTVFPSHLTSSNNPPSTEIITMMTDVLTAESLPLSDKIKTEYAVEMEQIVIRHSTASRIAHLSSTLNELKLAEAPVKMIPSPILNHKSFRDLIITAVRTIFSNDQARFMNFIQNGVLTTLYGSYWNEEEMANLFMGQFDPSTTSETVFLNNLPRVTAFNILNFLAANDLTEESKSCLIEEYERKVMKLTTTDATHLIKTFSTTIDELIDRPLNVTLNAIFNKAPLELASEFGYRMAALGCGRFEQFIITTSCRNGDVAKLARIIPPVLYKSLFQNMVQYIKCNGQSSEPLFRLLITLRDNYVDFISHDAILTGVFTSLTSFFRESFVDNLWFFELVRQFVDAPSNEHDICTYIEYSFHPEISTNLISILDEVNTNMFQYERGTRTLFQRICSTIGDIYAEIDLAPFNWLTTCSLKRTKLPSSVFR